jgi:hypothetical protein
MKFLKYIEGFKDLNSETQNTYLKSPKISFNKTQEIKDIFYEITYKDFIVEDIGVYQTIIKTSDRFKNSLTELNTLIKSNLPNDIKFQCSIEYNNFNRIDFESGIPNELKGLKLGYKIYIALCKYYKYISTMNGVNPEALNVWYSLVHDNDLYVVVNKQRTLIIDKNFNKIKEVVNLFLQEYSNSDMDDNLKKYLENEKMDSNQ